MVEAGAETTVRAAATAAARAEVEMNDDGDDDEDNSRQRPRSSNIARSRIGSLISKSVRQGNIRRTDDIENVTPSDVTTESSGD